VGIIIKSDSKGRVLIPLELREELGADEFILEKTEKGLLLKPIPGMEDPIEYAKKIAIKNKRPVRVIRRGVRRELEGQ